MQLYLGLEATGEPDERGLRTVVTTLNGQLRPLQIRDRSVDVDVPVAERADPGNPMHVASPFAGVVTLAVAEGDEVQAGATVATIEAMKMEASITAPRAGRVQRTAINTGAAGRGRRPAAGADRRCRGRLTRCSHRWRRSDAERMVSG